jgi:type VI secretion system protein ImpM
MSAGLFGKLPARRDFISANASKRFLHVWEPWLQSGIAMSRRMLGPAWTEAYNRAPIWRFWLGPDFCGEATIGAFMPSVDGVGRAFPLTIFAGEAENFVAPPEVNSNERWCEDAEAILLEALEEGVTLEAILDKVAMMPAPFAQPRAGAPEGLSELRDGAILIRNVDRETLRAFGEARQFGNRRAFARQSFWWTIGGEGFQPLVLSQAGLPTAVRFTNMLTGVFVDVEASAAGEAI